MTAPKMKSAEEWMAADGGQLFDIERADSDDIRAFVKAIQLDALKAGMTEAAEKVLDYARQMRGAHVNTNTSAMDIRATIFEARDTKTINDV